MRPPPRIAALMIISTKGGSHEEAQASTASGQERPFQKAVREKGKGRGNPAFFVGTEISM
jgi:hypothetical protein